MVARGIRGNSFRFIGEEDEDDAYYEVYEKIEKLIMEKCIKIDYNIVRDKNYCVRVKVIG